MLSLLWSYLAGSSNVQDCHRYIWTWNPGQVVRWRERFLAAVLATRPKISPHCDSVDGSPFCSGVPCCFLSWAFKTQSITGKQGYLLATNGMFFAITCWKQNRMLPLPACSYLNISRGRWKCTVVTQTQTQTDGHKFGMNLSWGSCWNPLFLFRNSVRTLFEFEIEKPCC